jgi:hypothetical protein
MKYLLTLNLTLLTLISICQHDIQMNYVQTDTGYDIVVDNNMFCPVSLEVSFDLKNLKSNKGNNKVFIVPTRKQQYVITSLIVVDISKGYKFAYESRSNYGNENLKDYDRDYIYQLPFARGSSSLVMQGYDGKISHKNVKALDFDMPIGTDVHTVRKGVVVELVESNHGHCPSKECADLNNFIIIYHSDGSFAEYTHIKQDGALVEVGDTVQTGQLIAHSGDVGWSSGPHLHLSVFLPRIEKREYIETLFRTDDGNRSEYLKEGVVYRRDY